MSKLTLQSVHYIYYLFLVAIPVSMFLSSLLTAAITTLIVYFVMTRKRCCKKETIASQLVTEYELPKNSNKETIDLKMNTAYGHIQY